MKIKALQNFGHGGENIARGTILDVKPEDFGGTYQDFIEGGFFEEGSLQPKVVNGNPVVENDEPVMEWVKSEPVADVPADTAPVTPPKAKGAPKK